MREKVVVSILTPLSLAKREDGDRVIKLWENLLPDYLPDKYGNWEPINKSFDLNNREIILDAWQSPFLTKKSKPKLQSNIFMRKSGTLQHADWYLEFPYNKGDTAVFGNFLRESSKELEADFGCLTLLTEDVIMNGLKNGTVTFLDKKQTHPHFGVYSIKLQKYLPDLFWTTIFGYPYIKMFGKEKLLSAPVHSVQELGETVIALQLTPSLEDMKTNPFAFDVVKRRVIKYLGEEAFFHPNHKEDNYLRPIFEWK